VPVACKPQEILSPEISDCGDTRKKTSLGYSSGSIPTSIIQASPDDLFGPYNEVTKRLRHPASAVRNAD